MTPTITIALDVDDVLLAHCDAWVAEYNKVARGHQLRLADLTAWGITDCMTADQADLYWNTRTPGLYVGMRPVECAQLGVRTLLREGFRLVAVTSDKPAFVTAKRAALARWFPELRDIVFAKNKACVQADLLVDDAPHNNPRYLFTRPWNVGARLAAGQARVNGWPELLDRLCLGWDLRQGHC